MQILKANTRTDAKLKASTELDNLMDAGFNFRNDSDGKYGHTHADVTGDFYYPDDRGVKRKTILCRKLTVVED